MVAAEKRRPHRIPLTQEEVAQLIVLKKLKEAKKLAKYKSTLQFKAFNIFNICCFFVYCEVLFCYVGPCNYQTHYGRNFGIKYGDDYNASGKRIISEIDIFGVDNTTHKLYVRDYIEPPQKFSSFQIGKDFILQKDLKAILNTSDESYGLNSASSIIFLAILLTVISVVSFFYNLNENSHSLTGVGILNAIIIVAFLLL
jgi:hypothetical protein